MAPLIDKEIATERAYTIDNGAGGVFFFRTISISEEKLNC